MLETKKENPQNIDQFDVEAVNKAGAREPLYAARKKVFPKRASGSFRKFKWAMMIVTLAIYYITPWLRWERGEFAPDQLVLIDLQNRRFFFAFIEIWPHEFYYVAGLLVMAGIGLFLITSTVGRAWCGYACPQTVWVDLFLVVERAIEGDRNARIKQDKAAWSFDKTWRVVLKHFIWILIGISTGGAWIFYFADAPTLAGDLLTLHAAPVAYMTIAILAATTYTFGGLMREQVCTYMCPWPRIQAAMLDEYSLTVTYNEWRGEPRTKHAKKAIAQGKPVGDCVDCNACVAVCPMGIDIRDGQQLECITCALCIDACDNVMDKIGKERGLISYATLNDYNINMRTAMGHGVHQQGDPVSHIVPANVRDAGGKLVAAIRATNFKSIVRPRTLIYFGVWAALGLGMMLLLATRERLDINAIHDRNPLYVLLADGSIRNGYELKILNMTPKIRFVELRMEGLEGGSMRLAGQQGAPVTTMTLELAPDQVFPLRIYVQADIADLVTAPQRYDLVITDELAQEESRVTVKFEAPHD